MTDNGIAESHLTNGDTLTLAEPSAASYEAQRDNFIDRMLQATSGLFDIFTIHIGSRLGLYGALAKRGWMTSVELAHATQTHERYVREWLEQQTVAGILEVEDEAQAAQARRFRLPLGHQEVLAQPESLNYLAPLAQIAVGAVYPIHALIEAYRTGGGVPYGDYGVDLREGQAGMNRNLFLYELGQVHLPAIPDVHARLQADPPARIADIGCGLGWSSIGMAQTYPNVLVDGYDLDTPSIEEAWTNARAYGLTDRLTFHARDAGDMEILNGRYDLVTAFECVHDLGNPVGVLRTMRRLAGERGAVIVMDERVGDTFTARGNEVEWMMYGWSVLHCLPVGLAEHQPSAGTGTVMRTDTLRRYAQEAGFREVEVLPIDNFFFRFYRLRQ
jgi:2-polyprenyl-3-methyl-5-hydroxy-6-metoxy-1,4-benzoquinol methylase